MKEVLAVIGGSGLYALPGLTIVERHAVETPYGPPSDVVIRGEIDGATLLFLPRHGAGHRHPPHAINYRANVCALKQLGATQVLSVSAVGSMRETIRPGDLLVVDQFIDATRRRVSTFFDDGATAHVAFADPVCAALAGRVAEVAAEVLADLPEPPALHRRGTYVCIDGPQFSTRAESRMYREWGGDVIGMTGMPEARLAREAELPYALLGMITDYDCWREGETVDAAAILQAMRANAKAARAALRHLLKKLPAEREPSPIDRTLDGAIVTPREQWDPQAVARLDAVAGRLVRSS